MSKRMGIGILIVSTFGFYALGYRNALKRVLKEMDDVSAERQSERLKANYSDYSYPRRKFR